jgi:hypothetical protein
MGDSRSASVLKIRWSCENCVRLTTLRLVSARWSVMRSTSQQARMFRCISPTMLGFALIAHLSFGSCSRALGGGRRRILEAEAEHRATGEQRGLSNWATAEVRERAEARVVEIGEPAPARRPPPAEEAPPDDGLTCEVIFWRGYWKAKFYACTRNEFGEQLAIAESPFFRPHSKTNPERTDSAVRAHDELSSTLIESGWECVRTGPAWYQARFQHTVRAAAAQGRE